MGLDMTEPAVDPGDAPFTTTAIPTGWDRFMTQAEADAANLLYPVPPYGDTFFDPGPIPFHGISDAPSDGQDYVRSDGHWVPAAQANAKFVKLQNVTGGLTTHALVADPAQLALLVVDLIFVLWPIQGVLGIVDDVGARPVRILSKNGNEVEFNFDSSGLDVTGLILLGVVYVGA